MIKLEHVTKCFGSKTVISDLSLLIPCGKHIAIMGESGKGKTTLLRIIAGLEPIDQGTVSGYDTNDITYVFQEPRLFSSLNALKNLTCVSSEPYKTAEGRALELLRQTKLEAARDMRPHKLSGGMKQRLSLARAFMVERPILLLDEPFSALDEETKDEMIGFVKEKCEEKTLILVTHDREDAVKLCDEIYTL